MADDPGGVRALLARLREHDAQKDAPRAQPLESVRRRWVRADPPRAAADMPLADAERIVAGLAQEPAFVAELRKLQSAQDRLEELLAEQRAAITGADGERMHGPKYVHTYHADSALRTQAEHARWAWDALNRWDEEIERQQQRLARLGVPYMALDDAGAGAGADTLARKRHIVQFLQRIT